MQLLALILTYLLDEMGNRIDDLERNIADLINQADNEPKQIR